MPMDGSLSGSALSGTCSPVGDTSRAVAVAGKGSDAGNDACASGSSPGPVPLIDGAVVSGTPVKSSCAVYWTPTSSSAMSAIPVAVPAIESGPAVKWKSVYVTLEKQAPPFTGNKTGLLARNTTPSLLGRGTA